MKNISKFIVFAFFVALAAGCGEQKCADNDLECWKKRQESLNNSIREMTKELREVNETVARLDTGAAVKEVFVSVDTLRASTFRHFIKVQGQIVSDNNVMVSPKMPGVITKIYVQEGQYVSQGQVLADIDATVLKSSIEELQGQLELAKTVFEKQERLWDQKIGTEIQYLQAKNNKESLEKRIATTNEQLKMARVTAPITGMVDKVMTKVGEAANPGFGAFQMVNLTDVSFKADLSESYIPKIKRGDKVKLKFPAIGRSYNSEIVFVGQTIDPTSRTVVIEAKLPAGEKDLKANMIGEIVVNDATVDKALVISQNLIQSTDAGNYVFTAQPQNGKFVAKRNFVQTGLSYDGKIQVTDNLKPGDLVVSFGFQDLSEGQPILLK